MSSFDLRRSIKTPRRRSRSGGTCSTTNAFTLYLWAEALRSKASALLEAAAR